MKNPLKKLFSGIMGLAMLGTTALGVYATPAADYNKAPTLGDTEQVAVTVFDTAISSTGTANIPVRVTWNSDEHEDLYEIDLVVDVPKAAFTDASTTVDQIPTMTGPAGMSAPAMLRSTDEVGSMTLSPDNLTYRQIYTIGGCGATDNGNGYSYYELTLPLTGLKTAEGSSFTVSVAGFINGDGNLYGSFTDITDMSVVIPDSGTISVVAKTGKLPTSISVPTIKPVPGTPMTLVNPAVTGDVDGGSFKKSDDSPSWLVVDPDTGALSGTPTGEPGSTDVYKVIYEIEGQTPVVSNEGSIVYSTKADTVVAPSYKPVPGDKIVLQATANGTGGKFALGDNAPEWMSIDPISGKITGTADPTAEVGETFGYTVTYTIPGQDPIVSAPGIITFSSPSPVGTIDVTKTISGDTPTTDEDFYFQIQEWDMTTGSAKLGVTNPANIKITGADSNSFEITYTNAIIGSVYVYKITEVGGSNPDYSYSDLSYFVEVTIIKNADGSLSAKVRAFTKYTGDEGTNRKAESVTFDNVYTEPTVEEFGSLSLSKIVTGELGNTKKDFTFTIELSDGVYNNSSEGVNINNGNGTITLKHGESVTLTNLKAGTTYTIKENNGVVLTGYTATNTVNGVPSETDVDANNAMTATGTIVKDKTDEVVYTNNAPDTPNTGILVDALPYIGLFVLCAGILTLVVVGKRKAANR